MRFRNDDQRKAMFASMSNRFSSLGKRELSAISEDLMASSDTDLFVKPVVKDELPEGTQSVYLISDFGSSHKTKRAATAASDTINFGEGFKSEVVPLFKDNDLIGHAVVAWESRKGVARKYLPSGEDLESMKSGLEPVEEPIRELAVTQPPIKDKWKEMEASMLTRGWKPESALAVAQGEKFAEEQSEYYTKLLSAFEASGEEDFERFKKKYDSTYIGKKFSRKSKSRSKRDYDGVYERGDDQYVCSYCGDAFSNETVAAIHAAKCDKNSFNEDEFDFKDEDSASFFDL